MEQQGINLLIDGVSSLIHHFHKSREEIIQTGEAAKSAMDAAASHFSTINTTVTNVKKTMRSWLRVSNRPAAQLPI